MEAIGLSYPVVNRSTFRLVHWARLVCSYGSNTNLTRKLTGALPITASHNAERETVPKNKKKWLDHAFVSQTKVSTNIKAALYVWQSCMVNSMWNKSICHVHGHAKNHYKFQ